MQTSVKDRLKFFESANVTQPAYLQVRGNPAKSRSFAGLQPQEELPSVVSLVREKEHPVLQKLGPCCTAVCTADAKLYMTDPDPDHWTETGIDGTVVLVEDFTHKNFFIRLYQKQTHDLLFEHGLYENMRYFDAQSHFHTFQADLYMVGLSFYDTTEAAMFLESVRQHIAKVTHGHNKHTGKSFTSRASATGSNYDGKLSEEYKVIFKAAGITDEMLKNEDTRRFAIDFIESHRKGNTSPETTVNPGKEEVIENINTTTTCGILPARETAACPICLEEDIPLAQGVECSGPQKHFLCHTCLEQHVLAFSDVRTAEGLELLRTTNGKVPCVDRKCQPYNDAVVARNVTIETFNAFMAAKEMLQKRLEEERIRILLEEQAQQLKHEFAKQQIELAEARQREIVRLRNYIIDDILTNKCPGCGQAWYDYENCDALTCSNPTCRRAFCAFCNTDCGSDSHSHVRTCPERQAAGAYDSYYSHADVREKAQRNRKQRKVQEFLRTLDANLRKDVMKACEKEFADIGFKEVGGQLMTPAPRR
eukprot:Colp12_sorted_trinity150504_noHs@24599